MACVFIIKGNLDTQRDMKNVSAERKDYVRASESVICMTKREISEETKLVKKKTRGLKGIPKQGLNSQSNCNLKLPQKYIIF